MINFGVLSLVQEEEFYVCIYATREGDYVLFHHEGGVDVGDVDAKAKKLLIGVDEKISEDAVKKQLLTLIPNDKKSWVGWKYDLRGISKAQVCYSWKWMLVTLHE